MATGAAVADALGGVNVCDLKTKTIFHLP